MWNRKDWIIRESSENNVSTEFLRIDVSALQRCCVSGGSDWTPEGFHILSFGVLQMQTLRDKIDPKDIFQQSAQSRW